MSVGFSIQVFGSSYLLTVLMPEGDLPEYCEFRRMIGENEQLLGKNGWGSPKITAARKMFKDQNNSTRYYTYFIDENVGSGAKYQVRFVTNSGHGAWKSLEDMRKVVLPAPKNVRAIKRYADSK